MNQQKIAAILAVSGLFFVLLTFSYAGTVPPFLPGWIVWAGWAAIALGRKLPMIRLFWIASIAWDSYAFVTLAVFTAWTGFHQENLLYWYSRAHALMSVLLSTCALLIAAKELKQGAQPTTEPASPSRGGSA